MVRKSPSSNNAFRQNYNPIFRKTGIKAELEGLYTSSKANFGVNSDTLKNMTDIAGNRGYSHAKRINKIKGMFEERDSNLNNAERKYVNSLLDKSYTHIKTKLRSKIKKRSKINIGDGYSKFEQNTQYLDNSKTKTISVPPVIQTSKYIYTPQIVSPEIIAEISRNSLEKKVVPVNFSQKPENIFKKTFRNVASIAVAIGLTLTFGSLIYGTSCKPSETKKDTKEEITELKAKYDRSQIDLRALGRNYEEATNQLATTQSDLDLTKKMLDINQDSVKYLYTNYTNATNQLLNTQAKLNKASVDLTIRKGIIDNLSNKLVDASMRAETATSSYSTTLRDLAELSDEYEKAKRQLTGYLVKEQQINKTEEQRIETGEIVDSFVSSLNLRFPIAIAKVDKKGKRLDTIVEIPFYGDRLVDTYDELNALAKVSRHYKGENVDDNAIDRLFARAKGLSVYGKMKIFENVPRDDLNSLAAMSEISNPKEVKRIKGTDGNDYLIGTLEQIEGIK